MNKTPLNKEQFRAELDYQVSIALVEALQHKSKQAGHLNAVKERLLEIFKPVISALWDKE